MKIRTGKAVCLALALLFFSACAADAQSQYEPLRAQIDALATQEVLAYDLDLSEDSWSTVFRRAGEEAYITYSGAGQLVGEQLYLDGALYERVYDPPSSGVSEDGWVLFPYKLSGISTRDLYADLLDRLPPPDAFSRCETTDGETVFFFSRTYLETLRAQQLEAAEEAADAIGDNAFSQFHLRMARETTFKSGSLTVKTQDGHITAVRLCIEREEPLWTNGMDGSYTVFDEKQPVTDLRSLTVLEMDEAAIRAVIDEAAATLDA